MPVCVAVPGRLTRQCLIFLQRRQMCQRTARTINICAGQPADDPICHARSCDNSIVVVRRCFQAHRAESYAEGAEVIIKANPFTAPQGKEFNGWSDGSKTYKAGDKLTMPKANVTLTAQWKTSEKPITEYWTVTFKNGDTVEKRYR